MTGLINRMWAMFKLVAATMTAVICLCGCASSSLANFHMATTVPQAVRDDVASYLHSTGLPAADISRAQYLEDGTGAHAVVITQELGKSQGRDYKIHILIYDKNNLRTKIRVDS